MQELHCGSEPLPTSLRSATLPKGEGKDASNNNLLSSLMYSIPRMDSSPYGDYRIYASAAEAYIFVFHFPMRNTTMVITMPSVQEIISDRNSASGFPWGNSSDRVRYARK